MSVRAGFQSGLMTVRGKRKPSFAAYRLPIWLPRVDGRTVRVWALVRSAPNGRRVPATIQFRGERSKRWRTLKALRTSTRGYLQSRVRVPGRGAVRVRYGKLSSRAARVTPR